MTSLHHPFICLHPFPFPLRFLLLILICDKLRCLQDYKHRAGEGWQTLEMVNNMILSQDTTHRHTHTHTPPIHIPHHTPHTRLTFGWPLHSSKIKQHIKFIKSPKENNSNNKLGLALLKIKQVKVVRNAWNSKRNVLTSATSSGTFAKFQSVNNNIYFKWIRMKPE